jgi:hypothetical protein
VKKPTPVIKLTEGSNLSMLDYMKLEARPKKLRLKRLDAIAKAFGYKFQLDCQP